MWYLFSGVHTLLKVFKGIKMGYWFSLTSKLTFELRWSSEWMPHLVHSEIWWSPTGVQKGNRQIAFSWPSDSPAWWSSLNPKAATLPAWAQRTASGRSSATSMSFQGWPPKTWWMRIRWNPSSTLSVGHALILGFKGNVFDQTFLGENPKIS